MRNTLGGFALLVAAGLPIAIWLETGRKPPFVLSAAAAPDQPPSGQTTRPETTPTLAPALSPGIAGLPPGSEVELERVQRVLDRYKLAYDQLDATAATAIWPQADARAMARMFAQLRRQTLNFDGCAIALSEAWATARCTGTLEYVPRVGSAAVRKEEHAWTIDFERVKDSWQIVQVHAR
jgi:hypothetical protein